MAETKDKLGLNYSDQFNIKGIEKADIDLVLSPSDIEAASIYGLVSNGIQPITDATIKVFDSNGLPFSHTLSDSSTGQYSFNSLPAGSYTVGVVADGYIMSATKGVTLLDGDSTELNFSLVPTPSLNLGAIAGKLLLGTLHDPESHKDPIGGAKMTLKNSFNEVAAITYTADDGEFAFYDITDGKYTIIGTADGYLPSSPMTVTITGGSIANIIMGMDIDNRTYNGTVSGWIKDNKGKIVSGSFVGLYEILEDSEGHLTENLIATTKTNASGQYLFGGIVAGSYVVKSKMNK